jgi:hypothetical protein
MAAQINKAIQRDSLAAAQKKLQVRAAAGGALWKSAAAAAEALRARGRRRGACAAAFWGQVAACGARGSRLALRYGAGHVAEPSISRALAAQPFLLAGSSRAASC